MGSQITIAHTQAAAGAIKIQKKAYGPTTQSRQVDGLFKADRFLSRPQLLNHTRVDFNILRPSESREASMPHVAKASRVMRTMRDGKCHQVYGISEFHQNSSSAGMKLHPGYQAAMKENNQVFKRTNGELTRYTDNVLKKKIQ